MSSTTGSTRTLVTDTGSANTCTCGQDLDCCTREHCPRCGRDLHSS